MSLFDDLPPPRPRPEPAPERAVPPPAPRAAEPRVWSVTALTDVLAGRLRELGRLAVEGEVTRVSQAGSGHVYFTLKDAGAVLDCKVWRSAVARALRGPLAEGARVVAHGALDVYAPRGTYSLIVDRVERRGIGELLARLEELKVELRARGWFDRARALPRLPRCVGLVTSRDADALQDILRTRSLRWPLYPLRLCHARVQGAGAAREIAQAIARLDASGVDVIILARGGGSLEDLWCFNELAVAEAIWAARVPVVTGVGHQTDVTLADLVADHRAHTPTDAAQTVIPDRAALLGALERTGGYLIEALHRQLAARAERLERLAAARVLRGADGLLAERQAALARCARRLALAGERRGERAHERLAALGARLARHGPLARLERLEARLAGAGERLARAPQQALAGRAETLAVLGRSLEAVSPFAVLRRGYSITRVLGGEAALRDARAVAPGERLETLLAAGRVVSEVREVAGPPAAEGSPEA